MVHGDIVLSINTNTIQSSQVHPRHPISLPSVNLDFKGQGSYGKVKAQIEVTSKHQLSTLYSFRDMAWTNLKRQRHYRKVRGQSRSYHDMAHLSMNVPTQYQVSTPYGF